MFIHFNRVFFKCQSHTLPCRYTTDLNNTNNLSPQPLQPDNPWQLVTTRDNGRPRDGSVYQCCRYCSTLDRLKEKIRRKRPGLLTRGVVLLHDNATPHSANLTQQCLQRYGWEILPHPAHSPDLAPSDFHLFGPLKRHLGGMAFETKDDLISELRNWFDNLDIDFFRVSINSLLSRWQKCIDLHGDYVER
ncbi:histone-lysine N-methyltransferase SETMAR [Plakobranchus ocellatus]|uniref:Histone-lysine N-methyltransferase SETMAR n=1 Tax=Plakobranchus ocellatus TaxID=259542 RepID=A0AAV4BBR2_9GAST|nr:histone-lysine N-methyltransferase SETMAR [Plakobranchus ocellatus]